MREFVLAAWFARWNGAVRHNLAASDSESLTILELLAMADEEDMARWQTSYLGYSDPAGSEWLRTSVTGLYQGLDSSQVACFAGAQEGLFCAMHAVLNRGDHAIVVTPCYQTAELIPSELCEVSPVPLIEERGWTVDLDALEAAVRPNTRLVSISFPNNPTGVVPTRPEWDAVVALCRRHGLWLFSDEVYRLIEHGDGQRLPPVADVYERGISLNVVSKAYGLAGLRLGWLACQDAGVIRKAVQVRERLSGSGAAPSEILANIAIRATGRIVGRNRAIAEANLALLDRFFARHADLFAWTRPQGGVVGFPLYRGRDGADAFAERLAATSGILIVPGTAFATSPLSSVANRFRIGFGRSDFGTALDALGRHIAQDARVPAHAAAG